MEMAADSLLILDAEDARTIHQELSSTESEATIIDFVKEDHA